MTNVKMLKMKSQVGSLGEESESEDIRRDFLLARCRDKRMESHFVVQVVSAIIACCEVK
jgi:hypothetical protein